MMLLRKLANGSARVVCPTNATPGSRNRLGPRFRCSPLIRAQRATPDGSASSPNSDSRTIETVRHDIPVQYWEKAIRLVTGERIRVHPAPEDYLALARKRRSSSVARIAFPTCIGSFALGGFSDKTTIDPFASGITRMGNDEWTPPSKFARA